MHSLDLLFGIATLCACLTALPRMVYAIPLSEFYPYGSGVGDAVLQRNDDGVSSAISLDGSGFRYFGNSHSSLFVSFYVEYVIVYQVGDNNKYYCCFIHFLLLLCSFSSAD